MPNIRSDRGRIVLGSLLYTAGSAFQYVTPAYLGEISARFGINEAQMGGITAAESVGVALASVLSVVWLSKFNRTVLALVGTGFCVILNFLAFFTSQFELLLVARFLTGLLGEGILFALAFVVLGSTRDPDRSFGIGLTSVVIFGSLVLGSSTYLAAVPVGTGILLPLAIIPLAIVFAIQWMPPRPSGDTPLTTAGASGTREPLAFVAVAGMTVWFAAPGAFWTFAESAAASRHIPGATISVALAVGNGVGLLGSMAAAWQGDRWGRYRPLLFATCCLCGSVIAFAKSDGVVALACSLSAFNAFWNYAAVYEMALVASLDTRGRAALAISAAQVLGFAAGGFISGLAISQKGYGALPIAVAVPAVGGMLVIAFCFRRLKPQAASSLTD